jgi:hypothetical protein
MPGEGNVIELVRTELESVIGEGVRDIYISPLEFLFDPLAPSIALSDWHGCERLVSLSDLRSDDNYQIPEWVKGERRSRRTVYGEEAEQEHMAADDMVLLITVYHKPTRTLTRFIETAGPQLAIFRDPVDSARSANRLVPVQEQVFPLSFAGRDDSPFRAFVPVPAQDDPYGISQLLHARRSALEADKLETRRCNLTRQIKLVWAYDKTQGLDDDQIKQALAQRDFSVVGLDNPFGKPLTEMFQALPLPRIAPELYAGISDARSNVSQVTGMSDVPYGGAETATESENMMSIGSARKNRKVRLLLKYLSDVAATHRAYLAAWSPPGQTAEVLGGDGLPFIQQFGREAFAGDWRIDVFPGGASGSVSPVARKADLEMAGMLAPYLTPPAQLVLMRQMLTRAGWSSVDTLLRAQQMGMGMLPFGQQPMGGQPQGMDGRARADAFNVADQSGPQRLRAGINQLYEG